nr:MAG TPA: hypothetical protein [Caudoviricetes sp.]DAX75884.1 MAG TPA: hypothetical protein [Caudoviricetes sp.]
MPSRCSLFCLYEKPCLSSRIAGFILKIILP